MQVRDLCLPGGSCARRPAGCRQGRSERPPGVPMPRDDGPGCDVARACGVTEAAGPGEHLALRSQMAAGVPRP
jgi:hypothetical protein